MRPPLALFVLALGFTGASAARAADPSWSSDEQAVAAADAAFMAASVDGHGRAWAEFADQNATTQLGRGKTAIGAAYDKLYARPGFRLSWRPAYAKVVGDIGTTSGSYELHVQAADGTVQRSTGTYVTVWQRQSDGGWRFVWDGGTPDK